MTKHHRSTVALAVLLALGVTSAVAADARSPSVKKPAVAKKHDSAKQKAAKAKVAPAVKASKPAPLKLAPLAKARPAAKPAAAQAAAKPAAPTGARAAGKPPASDQAAAKVPPVPTATFIPLGPERFYPNGIPELRPEFLHPLPDQQAAVQRQAAMQEASADERRNWFASPQ